ncbi:MAG: AMP-dependent synthetase/ligase [Bacteroidota bacterium]
MTNEITRIFDILPFARDKYNNKPALAGKKKGKWQIYSQQDFIDNANAVSAVLLKWGIKKGDLILNISDNRPEWNFLDFGLLQIGAVHVPVFPTISEDELKYILDEVQPGLIFISNRLLLKRLMKTWNVPSGTKIIAYDQGVGDDVFAFQDLLEEGKADMNAHEIEAVKASVQPEDLASVIYTSGTTTMPKGVMLSHKNHLANVLIAASSIGIEHQFHVLSYLPLSHSYERMTNYVFMVKGLTIYYNENMSNIISNFAQVKPGILITVPLLLERIYKGIINKQEDLKGFSKIVYKLALKFALSGKDPADLSGIDKIRYLVYNKLVFMKWKAMMGGKVTKIIVGGAAVTQRIQQFFQMIGVPVYEGYGLTEMAPLISFNNTDFNRIGSVGQPLVNVMVRISEDGEVLVKGPNMMKGYYMHEDLSADLVDEDGWLHTGDMGKLDDNGYLFITGRKKNIFKTSSGTYVYPERIENKLKLSSFIEHVMVVGEYQDYLGLLIVLNRDYVKKWAKNHQITGAYEEIIQNPQLHQSINKVLDEYNADARETHQIKKYKIISDEWTIDNGDLTPSMKLKRNNLLKKYHQVVSSFYE